VRLPTKAARRSQTTGRLPLRGSEVSGGTGRLRTEASGPLQTVGRLPTKPAAVFERSVRLPDRSSEKSSASGRLPINGFGWSGAAEGLLAGLGRLGLFGFDGRIRGDGGQLGTRGHRQVASRWPGNHVPGLTLARESCPGPHAGPGIMSRASSE